MQSIQSILNDARLVEQSVTDPHVQSLAALVQQLAIRVQEVEGIAATNEMKVGKLASSEEVVGTATL